MVSEGKTKKIGSASADKLEEATAISNQENNKGQITVDERKKKREIIEERGNRVEVPPGVGEGEVEKEALEQTGEDQTSGW